MQSGPLIHCPRLPIPFSCTCGYLQWQVHIPLRSLFPLIPSHFPPYFGYFGLFSYTSEGHTTHLTITHVSSPSTGDVQHIFSRHVQQ